MNQRREICGIVITLVLTMAQMHACAVPGPERGQAEELVQLKVNAGPFISNAPLFIAQEEGYFAEQRLDVEFSRLSTREVIAAVGQGDIDVAAGVITTSGLNSILKGANMAIVAEKGHYDPATCGSNSLVVRSDLVENGELGNHAQIEGMRVAYRQVTVEGYVLDHFLSSVDLTLDDIEQVDIPTPAELEALQKGSLDVVAATEPWVARMTASGAGVVWVSFQDVMPNFQNGVVYFGPGLLGDDPDVGRRFMVAYLKAVQQYNLGKNERNVEIIAEYTGLEEELLEQVCLPTLRGDGQVNVQSILDFQEWAVQKGFLEVVVPADQFWDPSFVEYANEVLGAPSE
jgi:NitT/TauT family transport system substrate-binding protein